MYLCKMCNNDATGQLIGFYTKKYKLFYLCKSCLKDNFDDKINYAIEHCNSWKYCLYCDTDSVFINIVKFYDYSDTNIFCCRYCFEENFNKNLYDSKVLNLI